MAASKRKRAPATFSFSPGFPRRGRIYDSASAALRFRKWMFFKEALMPEESKNLQDGLSRRGMLGAVSLTSLGLAAAVLPSGRANAAEGEKIEPLADFKYDIEKQTHW